MTIAFAITVAMTVCGLLTHYLKDLIRIEQEVGGPPRLVEYWQQYPYQTLLSIVGALVGYVVLYEAGELTNVTAFGIGYMSNSVADIIGKRDGRKL